MQVAKIERNEPQFLMPARTPECGESAGAGIREERKGTEESCQSPQYAFLVGNKGVLSLKDDSKVSALYKAEDVWVYSVSKRKSSKKPQQKPHAFPLWNCTHPLGYGQVCFDSFLCEGGGMFVGFI